MLSSRAGIKPCVVFIEKWIASTEGQVKGNDDNVRHDVSYTEISSDDGCEPELVNSASELQQLINDPDSVATLLLEINRSSNYDGNSAVGQGQMTSRANSRLQSVVGSYSQDGQFSEVAHNILMESDDEHQPSKSTSQNEQQNRYKICGSNRDDRSPAASTSSLFELGHDLFEEMVNKTRSIGNGTVTHNHSFNRNRATSKERNCPTTSYGIPRSEEANSHSYFGADESRSNLEYSQRYEIQFEQDDDDIEPIDYCIRYHVSGSADSAIDLSKQNSTSDLIDSSAGFRSRFERNEQPADCCNDVPERSIVGGGLRATHISQRVPEVNHLWLNENLPGASDTQECATNDISESASGTLWGTVETHSHALDLSTKHSTTESRQFGFSISPNARLRSGFRNSEQLYDRHYQFPKQFYARNRTNAINVPVPQVPQVLDARSAFERIGPFEYSRNLLAAPLPVQNDNLAAVNGTQENATNVVLEPTSGTGEVPSQIETVTANDIFNDKHYRLTIEQDIYQTLLAIQSTLAVWALMPRTSANMTAQQSINQSYSQDSTQPSGNLSSHQENSSDTAAGSGKEKSLQKRSTRSSKTNPSKRKEPLKLDETDAVAPKPPKRSKKSKSKDFQNQFEVETLPMPQSQPFHAHNYWVTARPRKLDYKSHEISPTETPKRLSDYLRGGVNQFVWK